MVQRVVRSELPQELAHGNPKVPLEHAHEEMVHHAHESGEPWIMGVALTAVLLAVLAAITALLGEEYADEAMHAQIKSSDRWSHYQAKSIKSEIVANRMVAIEALEKSVRDAVRAQLKRYGKEQDEINQLKRYEREQKEIKEQAEELEAESQADLVHHGWLGRGVTMFQIAIAISAISVLTRRKAFWFVAIGFGAAGLVLLLIGAKAILCGWAVWLLRMMHL